MKNQGRWFWGVVAGATIGLGLAEYLFARSLTLASAAPAAFDLCGAVFRRTCDETLRAADSSMLGLPLAAWGVVYYGSVTILLLLGWAVDRFRDTSLAILFPVTLLAAAASLWFAASLLFGSVALCPLCLIIHALNLAMVVPAWRLARGRSLRLTGSALAGCVGALAAAVVLHQWAVNTWDSRGGIDPQELLATYRDAPRHEIPGGKAPVRLVVFSDLQCPACRRFAGVLGEIRRRFPERVAVEFRHYPLSSECQPGMKHDLHPGSCRAAWAAEAARRQAKFWEYHDLVLGTRASVTDELLREAARRTGLAAARFEADRADPEIARRVQEDIALGTRLGIDGTPAVFLNGKRVRDLRFPALLFLIAHLLG